MISRIGCVLTYNGVQASQGSTDGKTAEARLGDRAVNDSLVTEAVQKSFRDLVTIYFHPLLEGESN